MLSTPRGLWLCGAFATAVFTILLVVRLEFFRPRPGGDSVLKGRVAVAVRPGETWMAIHQNRQRIGFSHRIIERTGPGYRVVEKTVMKINTMGMVQDLVVTSESDTEPDFSLRSFEFEVVSGRFRFQVTGRIENSHLRVTTRANNDDPSRPVTIPLETRPYLTAGIVQAMGASGLAVSDRVVVFVFDPVSMGQVPVTVKVLANETLQVMGKAVPTKKLSFEFKGVTQHAWIDDAGRVVKEEGILGMSLTLTSREEALEGAVGGDDLTLLASIAPDRPIEDPQGLTRLEVKISGIDTANFEYDGEEPGIDMQNLDLDGGRQSFVNSRLTVTRERLPDNQADGSPMAGVDMRFLAPGPFIRSDHPRIVNLAGRIGKSGKTPLEKIRALLRWMDENIEKRPVLSLPDAVSTLRNRMGDCNEHAVLFAAFCRALGIPARVEAGLVYLNHRFFYHAWNGVYLGRWITVDSLFNQLPADVTHIRLASGAGGQGLGLGMVGVIGRIKLEIVGEGAMIELGKVTKNYGRLVAVDRLSLTVPRGEIFGFIGPNGAGKTTTIQMIAGLISPTSGTVKICGVDMAKDPSRAKKVIGFIPDRPYLYEKLTAMEFLKFTADLFGVEAAGFEKKAEGLLALFSLGSWADEIIESFSHGMKQRLIMAAALLHEPEVIVVDEPMVGLDPSAIKMVKELFKELAASGKTVFMSTHTLHIAEDLCHRIGVIHRGKLLALGTVAQLKEMARADHADLEELFMILTDSKPWGDLRP